MQVIGSGVGFYQEFFISLQEGLTKERVLNSPSECSAVIAAFMECLRFCLLRDSDSDGPDVAVQEYLIKEQVGSNKIGNRGNQKLNCHENASMV